MDGLHIFLVALLGVVSCSHDSVSGSVLEATVRPGDNITLYCDCELSARVRIVWYRNCSHENQPSLVLKVFSGSLDLPTIPPRFQFERNFSSESYDLLIMNISDTDEGLYYCGTEERRVEDKEYITQQHVYRYGIVTTRILLDSSLCPDSSRCIANPALVAPWLTAFTPAFTILSSFIAFILVFHFCQKTDKEPQIFSDTRRQTRWDQDEDACFTRVVFWAKDG